MSRFKKGDILRFKNPEDHRIMGLQLVTSLGSSKNTAGVMAVNYPSMEDEGFVRDVDVEYDKGTNLKRFYEAVNCK
jgi:hypothetical protein